MFTRTGTIRLNDRLPGDCFALWSWNPYRGTHSRWMLAGRALDLIGSHKHHGKKSAESGKVGAGKDHLASLVLLLHYLWTLQFS